MCVVAIHRILIHFNQVGYMILQVIELSVMTAAGRRSRDFREESLSVILEDHSPARIRRPR